MRIQPLAGIQWLAMLLVEKPLPPIKGWHATAEVRTTGLDLDNDNLGIKAVASAALSGKSASWQIRVGVPGRPVQDNAPGASDLGEYADHVLNTFGAGDELWLAV